MNIWKLHPTLSTCRLTLKFIALDDAGTLLKIFLSEKVREFVPIEAPQNIEESKKWISNYLTQYTNQQSIRWVMIENSTKEFVGTIALKDWDHYNLHAEIGYSLVEEKWGLGFATEAIQKVCEFGFNQGNLNLIHAHTHPQNIASQKVLLKNGYEKEGILKQRLFYLEKFYDFAVFSKVNPNKL